MLDAMLSFLWPEGMGGLTYAENEYDPAAATGSMDLVFPARWLHHAGAIYKEWYVSSIAARRVDRGRAICHCEGARRQRQRAQANRGRLGAKGPEQILQRFVTTKCPATVVKTH